MCNEIIFPEDYEPSPGDGTGLTITEVGPEDFPEETLSAADFWQLEARKAELEAQLKAMDQKPHWFVWLPGVGALTANEGESESFVADSPEDAVYNALFSPDADFFPSGRKIPQESRKTRGCEFLVSKVGDNSFTTVGFNLMLTCWK